MPGGVNVCTLLKDCKSYDDVPHPGKTVEKETVGEKKCRKYNLFTDYNMTIYKVFNLIHTYYINLHLPISLPSIIGLYKITFFSEHCPELIFKPGPTSIHWSCGKEENPYSHKMETGTICHPTHT